MELSGGHRSADRISESHPSDRHGALGLYKLLDRLLEYLHRNLDEEDFEGD